MTVIGEPIAKVVHEVYYSPLSLYPFPPMGAREVVSPQCNPAPTGGRMSAGQEGGFEKNATFSSGSVEIR